MNLYKKYPNFPKYRVKLGLSIIGLYVVCIIIHIIGIPYHTLIAIIGSVILISFNFFCMAWNTKEQEEKWHKF